MAPVIMLRPPVASSAAVAISPGLLASGTNRARRNLARTTLQFPVMLFALLLGMSFYFLHEEGAASQGVQFEIAAGSGRRPARRPHHRCAILDLGIRPLLTAMAGVVSTMIFGVAATRLLWLRPLPRRSIGRGVLWGDRHGRGQIALYCKRQYRHISSS